MFVIYSRYQVYLVTLKPNIFIMNLLGPDYKIRKTASSKDLCPEETNAYRPIPTDPTYNHKAKLINILKT